MHSCQDLYRICRSMLEPTSRATWSKQWQWLSVWRLTKVETGPKPVDPEGQENSKSKINKGMWRRYRGALREALFWSSKANKIKNRARGDRAISNKRSKSRSAEEGSSKANATIVVAIMRCGTARSGRI